jgi:uncharacterized RDD family membrane protein YckC
MKCPKCGYLGFDDLDRCRNCGYDFSLALAPAAPLPELEIRSSARAPAPLEDLALVDGAADDRSARQSDAAAKLPLFSERAASEDLPLITKPSPPRPPLSVRRATPEVPRTRTETPRTVLFDLESTFPAESAPATGERSSEWIPGDSRRPPPAGILARVTAVLIDLGILAAIDLLVVYFTMQICGLTMDDFDILPKGPLFAFLFVQNTGYFVAFTPSGQTLGKMAMGIRVVPTGGRSEIDLTHSLVRTIIWVILAIPGGIGFLTAFFSRDRRGLHDRFAKTRVIKGMG